jgi:hypothetical protein
MGRIITLSVAVLMTIGGTGVVLSETVKQTSWGDTTKAVIMQVPSGETTATDPSVTGFAPLSGPTMGNLMPDFDLLSDTMMGDPNNPNSFISGSGRVLFTMLQQLTFELQSRKEKGIGSAL